VIARFIAWIRDQRIRHHHARAHQHGTATLAAQIERDWSAAGAAMKRMHAAQAKRDALIDAQRRHAWGVRHLPNGDFEVTR
jgi:hypothetical protein